MKIDPESTIYAVLKGYNSLLKEFVQKHDRVQELKDHFDATFDIRVDGLDVSPDPKRPYYIYDPETFFKIYRKFKKRENYLSKEIQSQARWINMQLDSGFIIEFLESEEGEAEFSEAKRMLSMIDSDDFDPGITGLGDVRLIHTSTKLLDYKLLLGGDSDE